MLINSGPTDRVYQVYIIHGQNMTQIIEYKQLNNTNQWNPCIPMPFGHDNIINITFVDNENNDFRDWYPLQICDYPHNVENYKNEYLFDQVNNQPTFATEIYHEKSLNIHNLVIHDYIINVNRNYPIARNTPHMEEDLTFHYGSFINITKVIIDALFHTGSKSSFYNSLFSNISAEMIFYSDVKHFFLYLL